MQPGASDSGGAGPGPSPAAAAGAPGERRPEPGEDAAAPRGPGGRSWRVAAAVGVLAAASFYLGSGAAGGAGLGAVLLRFSLTLLGAAAVYLLGTLLALVFRSRPAPPPDFAAAWSRLAARRRPGVSTRLPRPGPPASGARRRLPGPRGSRRARPLRPAGGSEQPLGPGGTGSGSGPPRGTASAAGAGPMLPCSRGAEGGGRDRRLCCRVCGRELRDPLQGTPGPATSRAHRVGKGRSVRKGVP